MKNKRRIFLLAVALGALLGAGIAFWRVRLPTSAAQDNVSVQCPTSVVQKVVEDAGQRTTDRHVATNAVPPALATNVAANVQPPKPPKPSKPLIPPAPPVSYAPNVPKARQVLLANRRIVVEKGRSFPKEFCAMQTPTARGTAPYVVISEAPVSREVRIQAVADGAKVIGFLPNNALLVEADAAALKNLEEDVTFLAAIEYEPTDKIQRRVQEEIGERGESGGRIEATIVLLNPADSDAVRDFVTTSGGKLIAGTPSKGKAIMAEIPTALVTDLAKKAEVKWIEKYGRMRALNDLTVLPQCMNVTPVWNLHGLDGTGEVVTIDDTGIDTGVIQTLHEDFLNKVVKIVDMSGYGCVYDKNGHGTHTAGSLVGSGAKSGGRYAGVAKGAKLYVQAGGDGTSSDGVSFGGLGDHIDYIFAPKGLAYDNYITSISLGNLAQGQYTYFCSLADEVSWCYPELLSVIANGNQGPSKATVNEPAGAKNCLAVGNTYSGYNQSNPTAIVSNSSRGPCADGRIKPDVVAPGQHIASCRSTRSSLTHEGVCENANYLYMSGSSMATPHVAGAAAIVRQWLRRDRGFDNGANKPSGALVKAILTGGANGGAAPDNTFGWGRVDLEATIFPTNGLAVYLKDRLPFKQGEEFVFRVTTTNAAPLNAQLAWIDYPAEEGASVTIQNDLDLSVQSLITGTLYGNGESEPDRVNTVESVRMAEAPAATYTVTVSCPTIKVAYDDDDTDLGRGGAAAIYIRGAFDPDSIREVRTEIPHLRDTTPVVEPQTVDYVAYCEDPLSFGNATKNFIFAPGCDIVSERLVIGNDANTAQHVTQTGGTVDITGSGNATSTTDGPVLLGHWPGTDRSYIMTGGAFYATNGITHLGWDGGCVLRIGGEETTARMRLRGLKAGGERSTAGSSLSVLPNGVLEIGASGVSVATANIPVTLAGGKIVAYENAAISVTDGIALTADSTIEVPTGVKLTLNAALNGEFKVNKTGSGRLILADTAQADKINLVEGQLTGPEWTPPASPATIDVLVAFEAGAKDYVETDQGMTLEEFSRAQVAKMNSVLPNTELDKCFKFRYVGCTNINVTCTDIGTALYRSTYSEDYPEYQPISNLRDENGADVVLVMIYPEDSTSGTAGGSYGLQSYETVAEHSEKAYSVVSVVAAVQQDTSVHEIGHLMGGGHPDKPDPGGQHWKDYSYGYYFADKDGWRWHTIMGYGTSGGYSYTAIPYFSSPEYNYRGVPVGTLGNDNTRTLRESCVGVSEWRPTKYVEPTEAEKAAKLSPSKPVLLVNAGVSTKPDTKDNWIVKDVSGGTQFSFEDGSVSASGSFGGGKIWNHTSPTPFSKNGTFRDVYGQTWQSVEEEMLVSLGLKGTKESNLTSFFQSGFENGQGRGCSITIAGLSVGRRYILHYMTDGGSSNKPSSFKMNASGYSGTPTIDYVKGAATSYATGTVGTAITASANEPLLVRVSNLRPNAQGKVVIDVGGATVNVLAISELPPDATLYYIARQP